MLKYCFRQAVHKIGRHRHLSLLIILVLGLGTGISATFYGVLQAMGGDPIPGQSEFLYYVKLNPTPLGYSAPSIQRQAVDNNLTWTDATALLRERQAVRQAAMAGGKVVVKASSGEVTYRRARFTTPEFFDMFARQTIAGRIWTEQEEYGMERVAVITSELAEQQFQSRSPIGNMLIINDTGFRVIGVVEEWRVWPKFYADLSTSAFAAPDEIFIPLHTALDVGMEITGQVASWGESVSMENFLRSATTTWLQYWVKIDSPEQEKSYREYLERYVGDRYSLGVYERASGASELIGLRSWLSRLDLVPDNLYIQLKLAYAFLIVCIVNVAALLLSKFQGGEHEMAIRHALGARRIDIIMPMLFEAIMLGLGGGVVALLVSVGALWVVRQQSNDYSQLVYIDLQIIVLAIFSSIAAGIIAAVIPAWRVAGAAAIRRLM